MGFKLSKVEDARLDRWTSVGYARQVVGRAGTKLQKESICSRIATVSATRQFFVKN